MRRVGPLPTVLLVTVAWLGSSTAWCFCAPAAPSNPSAHACCDDGPGLVSADAGCCRNSASGLIVRDAVMAGGGPPMPGAAASVAPVLGVSVVRPPRSPLLITLRPVVLRV